MPRLHSLSGLSGLIIGALSACAPVRPEPVTITSDPPGALIVVDGDTLAFAPVTVQHRRGRTWGGALDRIAIRAIAVSPGTCSQGRIVKNEDPTPDTVRFDMRRCLAVDPDRAYEEDEVDEPAEREFTPAMDYPDELRQQGITGEVLLEVVIDTTGRAEPESFRALRYSHLGFVRPARDAVLSSTYRPARISGTPVRVRVEIPISFSIRR